MFSCKQKISNETKENTPEELSLLKPTNIVPMGKPEVHEVNWDSVAEVKFSIKQEKAKLSQKFRQPHIASQSATVTSIPIDPSTIKKSILGKDVPLPRIYEIPESGYKVQYGDTIYAPIKVKVKQPQSKFIGPMKVMPTTIRDLKYINSNMGLPDSDFYCTLEASDNYMWFGSVNRGLIRYDGKSFVTYDENHGLYNNSISCLIEDQSQNIWMGTRNPLGGNEDGITKYDGVHFFNYDSRQGFSNSPIISVYKDSKGSLWFGTEGDGVFVYKKEAGKETVTKYDSSNGLLGDEVFSFFEDSDGSMCIGTINGICKFNGKQFISFPQEKNNLIESIIKDKEGRIWYSDQKSINCYNDNLVINYNGGKYTSDIVTMVMDDYGTMWMATWRGLFFFDGENFGVNNHENGVNNFKITNILKGKYDNLWLSAYGGVHKLKVNSFKSYPVLAGMVRKYIGGVAKDGTGGLWLSSVAINGLVSLKDDYFQYHAFKNAHSFFLYNDSANNLWFGGSKKDTGSQLVRYDGNTAYRYNFEDFSSVNMVTGALEGTNGVLWISTLDGLYKLDGNRLLKFDRKNGVPDKIIKMATDKKGNLWLCTRNGLSMFDGKRFVNYNESNGLRKNFLINFMFDHHGNIFLSTRKGISLLTFNDDKSELKDSYNYGKENDLEYTISKTFLEDKEDNIWAGSANGIDMLRPTDQLGVYSKTSFTVDDGCLVGDGLLDSVFLDDNNVIWWGTNKGIVSLDLNDYNLKKHNKPSMHLNEIDINQEFIDFHRLEDNNYLESISFGEKIKKAATGIVPFKNYPKHLDLPYMLNHLTFKFSAMDWKSPGVLKYQYILEGNDKQWSELTAENIAEYRNISHGKYIFKVKAQGKTGIWSDVVSFDFVINPPWWHTWWARALFLLLGIFIVYIIVRLRGNAIRREFEEKEHIWAITDKQNKRLKDFSFVTSHNIGIATANFEGLLKLLRKNPEPEILDMLDATSYKLNNSLEHMNQLLQTDDFEKDLTKTPYALHIAVEKAIEKNEQLIQDVGATLQIDIAKNITLETFPKYLDNIVSQLVKNALLFGVTSSQKRIEVFTEVSNGITSFIIRDFGLGFDINSSKEKVFDLGTRLHPELNNGDGIGLYITKKQVQALSWEIIVESEINKGSTFSVKCGK